MDQTPKDPNYLARKIVETMGSCTSNTKFHDCRVVIKDTIFNINSLILLSCSELFRFKFLSLVEEKKELTIKLDNISATTFQLILDTLYTGNIRLTTDNIKEFWQAVHQLQIDFLFKLCEDFVVAQLSIDNLAEYKKNAIILQSQRARKGILDFIIKNFSAIRYTETFLSLDMEDLKQVIESDDLAVESEDSVLQAIYGWVNENENERNKYLADLLQCARYCVASVSCINELSQHSLTLNNSQVKEIMNMAKAFKLDSYTSGFRPTTAIHRECFGVEHVGVYCNADDIKFVQISLKRNIEVDSTDIPALRVARLACVNGKLFACKGTRTHVEMLVLEEERWQRVCSFNQKTFQHTFMWMLAHNNCIFFLSKKKMRSFDPNDKEIQFQESIYNVASPQHALSFGNQILLFGSGSVDMGGAEETIVHAWHSDTKKWSHLVNLQFTAKDMTIFEDEKHGYILDPNGQFWKLDKADDTVVFTYIGKLWDVNIKLKGAILFMKTLHIFVHRLESTESLSFKIDVGRGIFQHVKIHSTINQTSNVVHLVNQKTATVS